MFEKLKFDQLYSIFTPVFSDNMSGFLRGHSCCSALLKLSDDWRQALDNEKDVAVVVIDLSKAFDSICHNFFTSKTESLRRSRFSYKTDSVISIGPLSTSKM